MTKRRTDEELMEIWKYNENKWNDLDQEEKLRIIEILEDERNDRKKT